MQHHGIHLHTTEKQRQNLYLGIRGFQRGERFGTETPGITELHGAQLKSQPGKVGERDFTVDLQLTAGVFLHLRGDLVAIVIGVHQQRESDYRYHDQRQDHPETDQHPFHQVTCTHYWFPLALYTPDLPRI